MEKKIRHIFTDYKNIYAISFQITLGILLVSAYFDFCVPFLFKFAITYLVFTCPSSNSMSHSNLSFDEWWAKKEAIYLAMNIKKEEFKRYPLSNGFENKEILIKLPVNKYEKGDILLFRYNGEEGTISHRLVLIKNNLLYFHGDGNYDLPGSSDYDVSPTNVTGKIIAKVPLSKYIRPYIPINNNC